MRMREFDQVWLCFSGRSEMGISLTSSPELVISEESPDLHVPQTKYADSPEFLENKWHNKLGTSVELSLENGIDESEIKNTHKTPTVKFSTMCQTFEEEFSPEASFELPPPPETEDEPQKDLIPGRSVSVGCNDSECGNGEALNTDFGGVDSLKVGPMPQSSLVKLLVIWSNLL